MKETLCAFVTEDLLGGRSVGLDEDLLLDGMIDSMAVVRLIAFIDDEFHYAVPFGDVTVENFGTMNRLVAYLESRLDGAA